MNQAIQAESASPSRRRGLQVSLSTLLLLTAVIAIAIAYRNTKRETDILRAQIPGLLSVSMISQIIAG